MHRTLMRAFPDATRVQAGLLYRVMSIEQRVVVYLQSLLRPDVGQLAQNGFRADLKGQPRDIGALQEKFTQGERFKFNLLCYPCKKIDGGGKNSKRVFLRQPEEREAWLARKAEQYGFVVNHALEKTSFSLDGQKADAPIRYYAVEFEGGLTIADQARFWQAYRDGIGAGKAYGLGLLLLAR
jgi:CRISPR system Cascade subunit CasE